MADIKKIKSDLLNAFNRGSLRQEDVARNSALDSSLQMYFSKASHMPRPLIFEAIVGSLKVEKHDKPITREKVAHILNSHDI